LILLSIQLSAFTQTKGDYITPIDLQNINLSDTQKIKLNQLEIHPEYRNIQFVSIGEIKDFINNSELSFNIPGEEKRYTALVNEFIYTSPYNYVWKGDIIEQYGGVVIVCDKGKVFGHIFIGNQDYEIQVFDEFNIFIEYNTEYILSLECKTGVAPEEPKQPDTQSDSAESEIVSCTGNVKALIVYTSAAQSAVSSISNTAYLALNSVNDALNNSGISWGELHLSLAAFGFFDFTESTSISQDAYSLSNNTALQQLRNQHEADIVFVLTDGDYSSPNGPPLGYAYLGPSNSAALAIVQAVNAVSGFTFAHETGHLFGCLHEEGGNSGIIGVYEYPHKFTTGWWVWQSRYRTILQQNSWSSYTRIQHYSNPDIEFQNEATGTATHDNARKLVDESCTVENFRTTLQPPVSAYITGPSHGNNAGNYTWSANVTSGQQPYTYLWKYSLDGTSYIGTLGTSQNVTAPLPMDSDLYLKLIVTDMNNNQAIDYFVTINDDAHGNPGHKSEYTSTKDSQETESSTLTNSLQESNNEIKLMTIYPNPAKNNSTIKYFMETKGKVQISVSNSIGTVVQTYESNHSSPGIFYNTIHTMELETGIYIVAISTDNKQDTQKLIIK